MTFLQSLITRAYPGALVTRLEDRNAFRVAFIVEAETFLVDREKAIRSIVQRLRPQFTRPRRLHWGRKK